MMWNNCPICNNELYNTDKFILCLNKQHYLVAFLGKNKTINYVRYNVGSYRIEYDLDSTHYFTSILNESMSIIQFDGCILPFVKFNTPSKCEKLFSLSILK